MNTTRQATVYNLVYDEEQIKEFARLIDTENTYQQLCIVARPKYHAGVKNRHMSPKMFFGYTPEMYVDMVRKYELPVGSYKDKGVSFPDDCLVIYGTTNSRNGRQAARKFIDEVLNASLGGGDEHVFTHLSSTLDSAIASSKAKTKLVTIDIDSKDEWPEVKEFLEEKKVKPKAIVETRGGYHVMLDADDLPALKGELHKKFNSKHTIGDMFCAVPGTIQGGFPVKFVRD
jgi:hypothetical protein